MNKRVCQGPHLLVLKIKMNTYLSERQSLKYIYSCNYQLVGKGVQNIKLMTKDLQIPLYSAPLCVLDKVFLVLSQVQNTLFLKYSLFLLFFSLPYNSPSPSQLINFLEMTKNLFMIQNSQSAIYKSSNLLFPTSLTVRQIKL